MPEPYDRPKFPARRRPSAARASAKSSDRVVREDPRVLTLQRSISFKPRPDRNPPVALTDVLQPWVEKNITKTSQALQLAAELWLKLVPDALLRQTRLVGFRTATLTVAVTNAPARAQLDVLLRQRLLGQLQAESKGVIYRVKTITANSHEKGS